MHNEFMAFVSDEASTAALRTWAERQGFPSDAVQNGSADSFIALLESEAPPKIVVVDLDNQEQPLKTASRLTVLCGPATKIIAVGSANDVAIYRNMIAAGMADYLVKPLTPETLTQAMTLVNRGSATGPGAAKESKIIVFVGVRGGVGTSTVATNTAWLLAHELKRKSALLDLDLQFGTSALSLDIEPGHGLRDVVSSPQRVDSLMVAGAIVNESDNFSVLSAEEPIDEVIHTDSGAVAALIKELRSTYQTIVVDMPRHLLATQKRLLSLAHEIVLVTDMTLAGIRDTLRIRTALKALSVTARITIVAMRMNAQRQGGVDEAMFAKGAQAKIDFNLPDDPKNVAAASNAGKTLGAIAKGSALTKVLLQLTRYLVTSETANGGKSKVTGKGSWGFFGSGKKAEVPQ